jgi:hypothetical protein
VTAAEERLIAVLELSIGNAPWASHAGRHPGTPSLQIEHCARRFSSWPGLHQEHEAPAPPQLHRLGVGPVFFRPVFVSSAADWRLLALRCCCRLRQGSGGWGCLARSWRLPFSRSCAMGPVSHLVPALGIAALLALAAIALSMGSFWPLSHS